MEHTVTEKRTVTHTVMLGADEVEKLLIEAVRDKIEAPGNPTIYWEREGPSDVTIIFEVEL